MYSDNHLLPWQKASKTTSNKENEASSQIMSKSSWQSIVSTHEPSSEKKKSISPSHGVKRKALDVTSDVVDERILVPSENVRWTLFPLPVSSQICPS